MSLLMGRRDWKNGFLITETERGESGYQEDVWDVSVRCWHALWVETSNRRLDLQGWRRGGRGGRAVQGMDSQSQGE